MLFLTAGAQTVDVSALNLDIWQVLLRLACSLVIGLVIGLEREYTHRPAGMRTHILVSLGACAVMMTGQFIFAQYRQYGATSDPARLAAQVISGVGFLGAGTIMREGANVKGLTTAASLWAVACLGIAAGGGYYTIALAGMAFVFVALTIFEYLQRVLVHPRSGTREYIAETQDVAAVLQTVTSLAQKNKCEIRNLQAERQTGGIYQLSFQAEFGRGRSKKRKQRFFEGLAHDPAVLAVRIVDEAIGVK